MVNSDRRHTKGESVISTIIVITPPPPPPPPKDPQRQGETQATVRRLDAPDDLSDAELLRYAADMLEKGE